MAIDFKQITGGNKQTNNAAKDDRPKSQFWLNIGYETDIVDENTGNKKFVSLPVGIPVDTQDKLPTNTRNQEFAEFQMARNDLLEQIMEVAKKLAPGEEYLLNLQIQLRRINEEQADIPADENKFVRKLAL